MKVKLSVLLLSLVLLVSTLGGVAQTCANGDDTCRANIDTQKQASDPRRTITIDNLSKYRADIHYDDDEQELKKLRHKGVKGVLVKDAME